MRELEAMTRIVVAANHAAQEQWRWDVRMAKVLAALHVEDGAGDEAMVAEFFLIVGGSS